MAYVIDTSSQLEILCILYVILSSSFFFTVFFALFNVCLYLRRLPRQSWMTITFYVLTIL